MKRLNVLCLAVLVSISFACTQGKKEPVIPSNAKGKVIRKPKGGTTNNEQQKEEERKNQEGREGNLTKEGFYMLKAIEEYKGNKLIDKLSFSYNSEARLERIASESLALNFSYHLVNDKLTKVEVHSSREEDMVSVILQFRDAKVSSLKEAEFSYANFVYEAKLLKSVVRKSKGDNAEIYEFSWNDEGNLRLKEGSFNVDYFYQEVKNKVYPDLNFILNSGDTEAYLTDYMLKRSKDFLSSKISKAGGIKREERYAYKFDELLRPIEVKITTLQGGKDLGTQTFKLSYL